MILRAFFVAAAFILAGCATTNYSQLSSDPVPFEQHISRISTVEGWKIHARLAFRTGDRGGSGSLVWERSPGTHAVELFGTFGENRIRITQDVHKAVLTDSKGEQMIGRTVDELLYARTGWTLPPMNEFKNWIIGLPEREAADSVKWNQRGQVTSFSQSGWKIRCYDYRPVGPYAFPSQVRVASSTYDPLVRMHRAAGEVQPVEVKLSIHSWGLE